MLDVHATLGWQTQRIINVPIYAGNIYTNACSAQNLNHNIQRKNLTVPGQTNGKNMATELDFFNHINRAQNGPRIQLASATCWLSPMNS